MVSPGTKARNDEIYKRWKNGESVKALSVFYGVTSNYVSGVIRHREEKYNSPKYLEKMRREYIKEKIKILKQLDIKVTDEVKDHLNSLKTELEIDQYAHKLIMDR